MRLLLGILLRLLRLLGDRGFWIDVTPLATLVATKLFNVSGDTAVNWIGAAQLACIGLNRYRPKPAAPQLLNPGDKP